MKYIVRCETTRDMPPHSMVMYWVIREGERTPPVYDEPYGPFLERYQGKTVDAEAFEAAQRRATELTEMP